MLRRSDSRGCRSPFCVGEELLDGGEHHTARSSVEQLPQVGPGLGLNRGLAQHLRAAREGGEELVVEIVAVSEYDHRGVGHGGLADDPPGVEGHGEALTGALGVPYDADAPVARLTARPSTGSCWPARGLLERSSPQRFVHRGLHGVELVVASDLLVEPAAAVVLEHDEVPHQVKEPSRVAHTLKQYLKLRQVLVGKFLAADGAPGLEPLPSCGEGAQPGLQAVGHHQHGVHRKQSGQVGLVGLELLPGGPDGGVGVGGVLELDHPERQPVHEQHHIWAPLDLVLHDGELVDGQPDVVGRSVEVDDSGLRAPDAPAVAVLNGHAVDDHAMERPVAGLQRRPLGVSQPPNGVAERLARQIWVEPSQRLPQRRVQHHRAVVGSIQRCRVRVDLRPMGDAPSQIRQPANRSRLDGSLIEPAHHRRTCSALVCCWAALTRPLDVVAARLVLSGKMH